MAPIQRMAHRNWLSLLVIILLFFPVHAKSELPEAEELFQKLLHSFQTVDFEGRLTLMSQIPGEHPVGEVLVVRKAPDKQRIEFIWPNEMRGVGMVMNRDERWRIRDDRSRGRRPSLPRPPNRMMDDFPLKNVQLLLQNYSARVLDGGSVAGRRTYLVESEPRLAGRPSRKIWVDAEMGVILKMENYDSQKRLRNLFAYSEINFEPKIDEAIFRNQQKPGERKGPRGRPERKTIWNYEQGKPDLDKIRDEAELNIILPDQPPAGFALESIDVLKMGERKNVHLKYADGLTVLSVFQSPFDEGRRERRRRGPREGKPPWRGGRTEKVNISGVECEMMSAGPMVIFRWNRGGIALTLMGELEQKEMAKIVSSFIRKEGGDLK